MEPTARKTFFTRRRLVAGGVVFSLATAVFVALGWPQGGSIHDVTVEFVRFETSDDGAVDYAVLKVHNGSSREWVLLGAREWLPLKGIEMFQALGRFATGHPTGETGRVARNYIGGGAVHTLKTNIAEQVAVPLPRMGDKGWVEIFCWTPPDMRRGLLGLVQRCWWGVRPPKTLWVWVRCEVPIQCGRERSNGKPVPPSVLSQEGKTSVSPP